ncbi:hypothetical protein DCC81_05875 [Chitinophaga parva]|uniref:Tail specific protease domain-containing protein n=1 Tax=Chitinophaga parva TaxID=2169414 RepID=A0A2T7BMV6_9BACT|nr:S41 family peptidase [Chitinophaga parva]PUZ28996.1 hypothetical protein DCC81_05875 [Chitinophaga parva]
MRKPMLSPLPILYIVTCLLFACTRGVKHTTPLQDSLLPVEAMQSDADVLWTALSEIHPGFGIYTAPDSMERQYRQLRASLTAPMTEDAFVAKLYPFLCYLGCGHTQVRHSVHYHPATNVFRLPFEVLVQQQRAWITTRRTTKLATGDEIIRMNGVPVAAIIAHGSQLYCGDGYVPSFKELYLSEYDGFEDACNTVYHWQPPYQLTVKGADGALKEVTLNAADTALKEMVIPEDKYAGWRKVDSTGYLGLYFAPAAHTALLEVPVLAYTDTLAMQKSFAQIAKANTKYLVLDMRHNGGGDLRIAMRLLSYLADTDFRIIKDLYCRLPDPSKHRLGADFDSALTENFKASCTPGALVDGHYHMNILPAFGQGYGPLPVAKKDRYRGELIVLTDGGTFSSGALFISALKAQRAHTIFAGRETAGTAEGCNGFAMQELTLPATGIKVEFPWLRVVSMSTPAQKGRGNMPDSVVEYTPADIVAGRDMDLRLAQAIIQRKMAGAAH